MVRYALKLQGSVVFHTAESTFSSPSFLKVLLSLQMSIPEKRRRYKARRYQLCREKKIHG